MLGSHFGWAQRNISVFAATTALTIYKCLYSIAACWIIMATISDGYGSWLTRILNMSFLQQFKNICFVFFMINPLIIRVLVGFMDRQQHFNPILMVSERKFSDFFHIILIFLFAVNYGSWIDSNHLLDFISRFVII